MIHPFTTFTTPEIWGGIECSFNRVQQRYQDQLEYTGHYYREQDIELIAGLGIQKLRYPILWEKHQPRLYEPIDWSWAHQQLQAIREHHITPVAGLLHHGSGPDFTDLADEHFATKLAAYAGKVAREFPWIEEYTPINEPLTTARFSGLYGLWHPHSRNDLAFARMLLNQVKGIVLAMKTIRQVNSDARLVQTEDLGKTYSTPQLQYQADFENHRRWLTFDLLYGKVIPGHPIWDYFRWIGISESELYYFAEHTCPPQVLGANHYLTSERYLDEQLHKYPEQYHGGNQQEPYADIEAVRVPLNEPSGLPVLLRELWDRYETPVAITEVHLHCSREEQLRWFNEVWETACQLTREHIPVLGVTTWSMLGTYGWENLLTTPGGTYEPGAFDVRSGTPRPTAIASLVKTLADQQPYTHPICEQPGWWKRDQRFFNAIQPAVPIVLSPYSHVRPLLIIGQGTLGQAFARICESKAINYQLLSRGECDIATPEHIELAINHYRPWAIINAAGYVRVDDAEKDIEQCFRDNTQGPEQLALACNRHGIPLMTFSSDLVFDGKKRQPYTESSLVNPLNIYGQSKARAEDLVLKAFKDALVIRTSAFFGPWDQYNFVTRVLNSLVHHEEFSVADDVYISPTYIPDLVNAALDLLIDGEKQVWHLANRGEITWADLARETARISGHTSDTLKSMPHRAINLSAQRPTYSVLRSEKETLLPSLDHALARYFKDRRAG